MCLHWNKPAESAGGRVVDVTARRSDQGREDLDLSCPTSNEPCSTGTSMTRAARRAAVHTLDRHTTVVHSSVADRNASKSPSVSLPL